MRLLQRYILLELVRVFASVLSVLTVLLVFVGVFGEVSENGLGPFEVLEILPFVVPSLLPFTIPATLLLTVTVVYGKMAGDQEVTAAKAAGINTLSLLWPSFLMAIVLSISSLALADQVIPWAVGNIQRIVTAAMENIFLDVLRTRHQFVNHDRGITIAVMRVEGKRLIMPTFQYGPPGRDPVTLQAKEATVDFDLENQVVNLHLKQGRIDSPGQQRLYLDEETYPFPLPRDIKKPKPRHQSIREIRRELSELVQRVENRRLERDVETALALAIGDFDHLAHPDLHQYDVEVENNRIDIARYHTEIHNRFALSTSCLFFALLGGPFAILQARRQFLTSFFMCFVPILILYYPIALLMMNLAKSDLINPAWGMWVGNLVLLIVALAVLRRVLKH